jgi:DNA-binding NarL/FixJ family response regulator
MMPVRLYIAAGTQLYADGLAFALAPRPGIEVVGQCGSVVAAIDDIRRTKPTVALVDVAGAAGLACVEMIVHAQIGVSVVALAVKEEEEEIVRCVEAGVAGYVTRDGSLADLIATVESVGRGEALCSPRIAAMLLRRVAALSRERREPPNAVARLTYRELEVVELIGDGLSNKEIAGALRIELPTVKNHVHNILEKLQVSRRGEAVARVRSARSYPRELDPRRV